MYGIEKIGEGAELMRRMGDSVGVNFMSALADRRLGAMEFRDAVLGCASCRSTGACRKWLAEHAGTGAANVPDFCVNAELMSTLSGKG